jgi:hypothetical protein
MQCVWRCRDFRDSIVQLDPDEMPNDEGNREFVAHFGCQPQLTVRHSAIQTPNLQLMETT